MTIAWLVAPEAKHPSPHENSTKLPTTSAAASAIYIEDGDVAPSSDFLAQVILSSRLFVLPDDIDGR